MAPEYIFTRHGESVVNRTRTISNSVSDVAPLTERGKDQAKEFLGKIQNRGVIAIYTSPLMRARETAQIVAEGFRLAVETMDGLREPYCGIVEGRNDEEAWKMHFAQEQAWRAGEFDYHIPGGESFNDIRNRFLPAVEQIFSRHRDTAGSVVIVSHGSVLCNMLPLILSNVDVDFARANPLFNCSYIRTAEAQSGLLCLEWSGKRVEKG